MNARGSDTGAFEKSPEELAEEIAKTRAQQREEEGQKGNGKDDWPDPSPIYEPHEQEKEYPLNALPKIISEAVAEYRTYGQQPISLTASSAIAAASLATQGLADVARDPQLVGPISLNFDIIAVSGERKTSADRHFNRAIREWQVAQSERMKPDEDKAKAAMAAWEAEHEGLLAKIRAVSGRSKKVVGEKTVGEEADIQALKDSLAKLAETRPNGVIVPKLFYEDVNAETLAVLLASGWPSASLWSDEGGLVIGSSGMNDENLMKFLALLNRLWDGHWFDRDRLTARCAEIRGRRFTVSLMMQPIVMARLLGACGGAARNMGFIARTLIAWPRSTIGERPYKDPPADMSKSNQFNARLGELLDSGLTTKEPRMALTPPRLSLQYEAKQVWTRFFNDVEAGLARTGEFGGMPDIGSKIAENAARMAGVFHVLVHGPDGEIDERLMKAGISVVTWHLNEARRIIDTSHQPEEVADAEDLLGWLLTRPEPIEPRTILQFGPPRLREKKRRDAALKILIDKNWVIESGRPTRLTINPKAKAP